MSIDFQVAVWLCDMDGAGAVQPKYRTMQWAAWHGGSARAEQIGRDNSQGPYHLTLHRTVVGAFL
jgi:hypothetical protein